LKDYQSRIALMPGKYGVPFRSGIFEEQNKIKAYILGLDSNSKLSNSSNSALKQNISTYLSDYKMLNDYIQVADGRIINLSFQIDLYVEKQISQSQIISQVINAVQSYLDISNFNMGDNIYISPLIEAINNVGGVTNVIDLRAYNMVGGKYSVNEIAQPYIDSTTRQINLTSDYTLFGEPTSMFEVKYPNFDIQVRVK
jgi:hypothetical protein